jgi:hypothetical protein
MFMHTPPTRFDIGIQSPHMSAQGDGQQFWQPSYSVANGMSPNTYVTNPFMTPPHPTSTAWATQQPTPAVWNGQSSPLTVYDPYTEEARLTQAFTLGTPAANTLMQLGNGMYYSNIKEACQARQMTLRQQMRHYPFVSRHEYQRMSSLFTFINPLGMPEPHGTKQLAKRLERAVESAIRVEKRNCPDGSLDLSLLGMPGSVSAAYIQQVQSACNIVTQNILLKPITRRW